MWKGMESMVQNGLPTEPTGRGIAGISGSSIKGILFILLALAVCFGYFYFFTDVLRSKEDVVGLPDVYVAEVKKPLPERPGQSAVMPEAGAVPSVAPDAATKMAPPAPPAVGEPAQSSTVMPPPPKPVPVTQKPVPSVGPGTTGKLSKTPVVKQSGVKPAASAEKSTAAVKTAIPAGKRGAVTVVSNSAVKPAMGKKDAKGQTAGKTGGYTLVVGTYVLKATVLADKARLEQAGLHPTIAEGQKKSQSMNRLLVADLSSYTAAQAELLKIKKVSDGAFMIKENEKFLVYAGSYFTHERAVEEQKRLREKGFMPILKQSTVPVSSFVMTVGQYASRDLAVQEASRLQNMGFKPLVTAAPTK
jgi:hypothetical protein